MNQRMRNHFVAKRILAAIGLVLERDENGTAQAKARGHREQISAGSANHINQRVPVVADDARREPENLSNGARLFL